MPPTKKAPISKPDPLTKKLESLTPHQQEELTRVFAMCNDKFVRVGFRGSPSEQAYALRLMMETLDNLGLTEQ